MNKWPLYKKVLVLFALLLLPTLLYLFLTTGKHNFIHLPYVTYIDAQGDTAYREIPDFQFINQDGDTITQEDYKGKIYVADFFFTRCPTICPVMTHNMHRLNESFGHYPSFALLSHTVDPRHDTPEVLKKYAEERHLNTENWNLVTGTKEEIYEIASHYLANAMEDETAPGGFLHSGSFILVDKKGRIRSRKDDDGNIKGLYDGTSEADYKKLKEDIKVLMAEYELARKEKDEKP